MAAPVALIAGNGRLPVELATALTEQPGGVRVFALEGEAGTELAPFDPVAVSFTTLGRLFGAMKAEGCERVIMAGGVVNRPELASMVRADWGTLTSLAGVLGNLFAGDSTLLTSVIDVIASRGFTVVGVADVAPQLLALEGAVAGPPAGKRSQRQIREGVRVARTMGELDVGQGCVVVGSRAVAIEGAEGTDAMLERVEHLRSIGRLPSRRGGVLVKWPKPQQDLRVDLPAIGPETVRNAHLAGLDGIGIAAGRTVVLDRQRLGEQAAALRISVHAVAGA